MNLVFFGIIIFILVFVLLSWFAKTSSNKIARGARTLIFILSVILEALHLVVPNRSFQTSDLIGNILGVLLGYFLVKIYLHVNYNE